LTPRRLPRCCGRSPRTTAPADGESSRTVTRPDTRSPRHRHAVQGRIDADPSDWGWLVQGPNCWCLAGSPRIDRQLGAVFEYLPTHLSLRALVTSVLRTRCAALPGRRRGRPVSRDPRSSGSGRQRSRSARSPAADVP